MTSKYNLRSATNIPQDKTGRLSRAPQQAGQQPNQPPSQQKVDQNIDPTQQGFVSPDVQSTGVDTVQWGNQLGSYGASETNPKPSGSYHFTKDQLAQPQDTRPQDIRPRE